MPQLRIHQLRVGGIVKLCGGDDESIATALVHDMGNLAKFNNLDDYWSRQQLEFKKKYGSDAHSATIAILNEAGLTKLAENIRAESDFYKNIITIDDYSHVKMPSVLTLYGDCRVAIDGVVSVEERVCDLEKRYCGERLDRLWIDKLEQYVQNQSKIDVRSIGEADVTPLFDELLTCDI